MGELGGEAADAAALLAAAGRKNVTYLHVQLPLSTTQVPGGELKTVVDGIEVNAFDIRQPGISPAAPGAAGKTQ
jgi:hypothetical protein